MSHNFGDEPPQNFKSRKPEYKGCEGCAMFNHYCYPMLIGTLPVEECPCRECLVKSMCRFKLNCDVRQKYINLYDCNGMVPDEQV